MNLALTIDRFLREPDSFRNAGFVQAASGSTVRAQMQMIIACGVVYGAVMGGFNGVGGEGWKQMLVSGSKVPLLFLVSVLLCLPSFFLFNLLAGSDAPFAARLRDWTGFQSLAAAVMAALCR